MFGDVVDRWARRNRLTVDVTAASVFGVACLLFGALVQADAWYAVLTVLLVAPLAIRRQWPGACAAAVSTVALTQWVFVHDTNGALPADIAVPVAIHAAAAYGSTLLGAAALGAGLLGAVLGGVSWPQLPAPVSAHVITGAFLAATVLAAWAFGTLRRARLGQAAALAERARLLEAEREHRDRVAELAERTRVAREMHDVLAHALTSVIAQADGGRYAAAGDPASAVTALATIGDHARSALAETKSVLGVLRGDPPDLAHLPALAARLRTSGLEVHLDVTTPDEVDRRLSREVYRIVQEGLTNVLRHAGPATRATVTLTWTADRVDVEVTDDGDGPGASTEGNGLTGMRERAAALGGTLHFTARPDGGSTLHAQIPTS